MKQLVKLGAFGVSLAAVTPFVLSCRLEEKFTRSGAVFAGCSQLLALLPSNVGTWLRSAFYFGTLEHCSWDARIGFGTIFSHRGAKVGPRVFTGAYCVLGHVDLGADVMLASRVSIPSGKRQHFDDSGQITLAAHFDTVKIGQGTWIGEGAVVMANVGSGSVVSAGAIVSRDMPGGHLVGGNPARSIKSLHPVVTEAA